MSPHPTKKTRPVDHKVSHVMQDKYIWSGKSSLYKISARCTRGR